MHRKVEQLFAPRWRDTVVWPVPAEKAVKKQFLAAYESRKRAIEQYMRGDSMKEIKEAEGVKGKELYQMLEACASLDIDEQIAGFRALVPYARRKLYVRSSAPSEDVLAAGKGASGLFAQLVAKHKPLRALLDEQAEKYSKVDPERRLPIAKLHASFLNELVKLQGETGYPFTLQNRGREGFRQALHARISKLRGKLHGSLRDSIERAFRPQVDSRYRRIQIDAHRLDSFIPVRFVGRKGRFKTRSLRPWLIAAVEVDSGACLGFALSVGKEINHLDVLRCLYAVMKPWKRRTEFLVPGLVEAYKTGAGMPSMFASCAGRYSATVSLDNALAHHADRIRDVVLKKLQAVLVLGLPGEPRTRTEIEQLFNTLTHRNIQHLIGGVRPDMSNRERAAAMTAAEEGGMTIEQMEEYLEVVICNYNAHPASAHYGKSPLQFLREESEYALRRIDVSASASWRHLLKIELSVRVTTRDGHPPHIHYLKVEYTNDLLRAADMLVGKDIVITVDLTDLRTVEAQAPSGISLGTLFARGPWATFAHDERLRKRLNREIEDGNFHWEEGKDPEQIVNELLRRAKHSAAAQPDQTKPPPPPKRTEAKSSSPPRLIADVAKSMDFDIEAILGAKLKG